MIQNRDSQDPLTINQENKIQDRSISGYHVQRFRINQHDTKNKEAPDHTTIYP